MSRISVRGLEIRGGKFGPKQFPIRLQIVISSALLEEFSCYHTSPNLQLNVRFILKEFP